MEWVMTLNGDCNEDGLLSHTKCGMDNDNNQLTKTVWGLSDICWVSLIMMWSYW